MSLAPLVTVVIVNYDTRDETIACVRSLYENTLTPFELVIVDNGSSDGSADAFRAAFPDAIVEAAGENLGFARGVNRGAAAGSAPWVLLLNPDTVVLPGTIDALVDFARRHPSHGVYGGRTLRPDRSVDPSSCWGAMTPWSLTCFALGLSTVFKRSRLFDPESLGRWDRDTVREVPIVTGCLLLASRTDWARLGGMDERYFLYGEDADFSARAWAAGLRPVVVPDAEIVHAVGGSTASSGRKMSMVMAGKATVVRLRWSSRARPLGLALLQAGAGARALPALIRRHPDATWAVVWRTRRDWRAGFPAARQTIFGLDDEPARDLTTAP